MKGKAFQVLCPVRAAPGRTSSGRRSSPEVLWPDGINHSSRVLPKLTVQLKRFRADWWSQPEHAKKVPTGSFLALRQRSKRADMGWGLVFSCPSLYKVKPNNNDATHTVFDRTVRAACGFESEYVRDGAVDFSAVRPRVHDMRVLIAVRGANRKTSRRDFFACFGWTNTVRAKPF